MDALRAAVQNGADAVYIGAKMFNARAYADNFDSEEIRKAVDYCHLRGARLYLTLNTMILEEELQRGVREAREAYLAGVDALIVADAGLADLVQKCCPDIPLHASTQMCIHNSAGARLAGDMGFKRAVLARELNLSEIRDITDSGIETEVFVHGALCSGVSGLCLLSSFIGQRSGNRGKCAQPCRLEYRVGGTDAYYLSMADLCAAEHLGQLIAFGVSSFKIEGRMKNSRYVGGVVYEYRRILDAFMSGEGLPEGSLERLKEYYNRTFTSDYLTGGTAVTAIDRPGNRNIDKKRPEGYGKLPEEKPFYKAESWVYLEEGQPARMGVCANGFDAEVAGEEKLPQAQKPLEEEIVLHSVKKTGGTPFIMEKTEVTIKGAPFISVAKLNALRKAALSALEGEFLKSYHARTCPPCVSLSADAGSHRLGRVFVQCGSARLAVESLRRGAERIYYAPETINEKTLAQAAKIETETGVRPYIALPPFLREKDMRRIDSLLKEAHGAFAGSLAGNFSQVSVLKKYFREVVADYTCNIANRQTATAFENIGFTGVCLSAELNKNDINRVGSVLPAEIVAYGYLPLMWLAHPLDAQTMTDRRGYTYGIQKRKVSYEMQVVLNPVLLVMRDITPIREGVDAVRLILETDSDTAIVSEYVRAVREGDAVHTGYRDTTQGHLRRGV